MKRLLLVILLVVLVVAGGLYYFIYSPKQSVSIASAIQNSATTTTTVTRRLVATATISTGLYPVAAAVSPDGTSVYVANQGLTAVTGGVTHISTTTQTISEYARNTFTGSLISLGAVTVNAESFYCPGDLTISPDGTSVYTVCADSIYEYSRNVSTGILTAIGSTLFMGGDFGGVAIAISPDGHFVYEATVTNSGPPDDSQVGNIYEYTRNTSTGVLTALTKNVTAGILPQSIVISSDGTSIYVYAANPSGSSGNEIFEYSRNISTGDITPLTTIIASEGGYYGMYSMSISPDGTSVYVTNNGNTTATNKGTVSEYSRDTSNGVLTSMGTIAAGWNPYGIVVSSDGTSVYVSTENLASTTSQSVSEYTRDTLSGTLSFRNTTITPGTGSENIAISPDGKSVYVTDANNNAVYEYSKH